MKKNIALICAILMVFGLAGCRGSDKGDEQNSTQPSESIHVYDPQKENAIPTEDLTRYAEDTGALTNYRVACIRTSDVESVTTIVLHDGKDEQRQRILYNTINPDGAMMLTKNIEYRFVYSESKRYTMVDDTYQPEDYTFEMSAANATLAYMVDSIVEQGFFAAILEGMNSATYNIIHDNYELNDISFVVGEETVNFNDVTVVIRGNYVRSISCTNGTQSVYIEVTGINDVNFDEK